MVVDLNPDWVNAVATLVVPQVFRSLQECTKCNNSNVYLCTFPFIDYVHSPYLAVFSSSYISRRCSSATRCCTYPGHCFSWPWRGERSREEEDGGEGGTERECVCVWACVKESQTEKEKENEWDWERERERERGRERGREREREDKWNRTERARERISGMGLRETERDRQTERQRERRRMRLREKEREVMGWGKMEGEGWCKLWDTDPSFLNLSLSFLSRSPFFLAV